MSYQFYLTYKAAPSGKIKEGILDQSASRLNLVREAANRWNTIRRIQLDLAKGGETPDDRFPSTTVTIQWNKKEYQIRWIKTDYHEEFEINDNRISFKKTSELFDIPTWGRILKILDKIQTRTEAWKPKDDEEFRNARKKIQEKCGTLPVSRTTTELIDATMRTIGRKKTEEAIANIAKSAGQPVDWLIHQNPHKMEYARRKLVIELAKFLP